MINLIETAHAGVISDAPSIASLLFNVLSFLLSVFGVLAIIMLVVSGMKYFLAFGDSKSMQEAKRAAQYSVIGIILGLGAVVLSRMAAQFFK